jgi:hypothetical protein
MPEPYQAIGRPPLAYIIMASVAERITASGEPGALDLRGKRGDTD